MLNLFLQGLANHCPCTNIKRLIYFTRVELNTKCNISVIMGWGALENAKITGFVLVPRAGTYPLSFLCQKVTTSEEVTGVPTAVVTGTMITTNCELQCYWMWYQHSKLRFSSHIVKMLLVSHILRRSQSHQTQTLVTFVLFICFWQRPSPTNKTPAFLCYYFNPETFLPCWIIPKPCMFEGGSIFSIMTPR